jgi:predicted DNA-binding mobile mystery protein A
MPDRSPTVGIQSRITRRRIDSDVSLRNRPSYHPVRGWVRAVREALGMSEFELGARMGVTQQRVNQIQRAEVARSAQLATLGRAAEALNCELVYYLAPKEPLEDMVWRQAFAKAAEQVGYDPADPDETESAITAGERAEALAPSWLDRRGLWDERPAADVGQPARAGPVPAAPSPEPWPGLP